MQLAKLTTQGQPTPPLKTATQQITLLSPTFEHNESTLPKNLQKFSYFK